MEKWEYKTIEFKTAGVMGGKLDAGDFTNQLNSHGLQGWEAVSCFDTNYEQGATRFVFVLLKRRIAQ